MSAGRSSLDFRFPLDGCWTADESVPEDAIAFAEKDVQELYARCGLALEKPRYGAWSGRKDYLSFQDILIARKI
jgi:hypothetical protein